MRMGKLGQLMIYRVVDPCTERAALRAPFRELQAVMSWWIQVHNVWHVKVIRDMCTVASAQASGQRK